MQGAEEEAGGLITKLYVEPSDHHVGKPVEDCRHKHRSTVAITEKVSTRRVTRYATVSRLRSLWLRMLIGNGAAPAARKLFCTTVMGGAIG